MLDWNFERRHWSAYQSYITGDVLVDLIECGWQICEIEPATTGRARLHLCTLELDGESLTVRVLDGPAVQNILAQMSHDLFIAYAVTPDYLTVSA